MHTYVYIYIYIVLALGPGARPAHEQGGEGQGDRGPRRVELHVHLEERRIPIINNDKNDNNNT